MAVWSAVPISQLEYLRIDADFYHLAYLKELHSWRRLDKQIGAAKLGRLIAAPVRTGRTPKSRRINGDEQCVRFIKTDTVREGSIDFDNSALLPVRVISDRDYIPDDALVITIIGATPEIVGRTAIVRATDPECVTNQNVAVIRTNGMCDPYYLTAYFQTKWGRDQLWRHSRRTEQVNLNCREVERVLVPNPTKSRQEELGDLVRDSFASADRSLALYRKAQQLVEVELGLVKLMLQKPMGYTARFSELETSHRADAEYFHVGYEPFLSAVQNYHGGWAPLRNITSRTIPNFDARTHATDFDYIEIGDVAVSDGSYAMTRISAKSLPANAKIRLVGGEILVSQVRPTRGAIAIIDDELSHATVCSGAFYVCTAMDIEQREIIWLYLRSMKNIFEKYCGGTSYPTIDSRYISKLPVPLFDGHLASRVQKLVVESKAAHRDSRDLLVQAKAGVEKLIEEAVQL